MLSGATVETGAAVSAYRVDWREEVEESGEEGGEGKAEMRSAGGMECAGAEEWEEEVERYLEATEGVAAGSMGGAEAAGGGWQ